MIHQIGQSIGKKEIKIFYLMGKEVIRKKIFNKETIINTEDLLPGIYLLKYIYGNQIENMKILNF